MRVHRFEADLLLNWLSKKGRKPLVVRGARQVGKSSLVRHLSDLSQRFCLELNFERYPEHADFFKSNDPKAILDNLSVYFKQSIDPKTSLLFLDEVQAAPKVIETLRYFYEECPELPVVAAGSLLDFVLAKPEFSVPVGRIEYFHLGPISFEDFLIARNEEALLKWIRSVSIRDTIPIPMHQRCLELVKEFWLIGGMPEVVAHYAEYHNFQEINNIKQNILQSYQEDFYKYGRIKQVPLLRRVFKTIPSLIGQKIKYVQLDPDSKSIQTKEALDYLNLAKVIHLVYHSHATGLPLCAQVDYKIFKTIFVDIGLLCSALGLTHLSVIQAPDGVWINRGSLAEQFIGQILLQLYPPYQAPELYYWMREQAQSAAELDYVWQYENHIVPIEVKAGKTGHLKSLHYFMREKHCSCGVRFNTDLPTLLNEKAKLPNHEPFSYRLLSLPFYLAGQLNRFIIESF
ncbi:MAG: AAA family ATPase [bacterium]